MKHLQILGILACLVSSFTQAILNSPVEILQTSIDDAGNIPSAVDIAQTSKSSSNDADTIALAAVEEQTSKIAASNDVALPVHAEEAQKDKVAANDDNETNSEPVNEEKVDKASDNDEIIPEEPSKDKKSGIKVKKSCDATSKEDSKEEDDKEVSKSKEEEKDDSSGETERSHTSETANSLSPALIKYLTQSGNLYKQLNPQLNPGRSIKDLVGSNSFNLDALTKLNNQAVPNSLKSLLSTNLNPTSKILNNDINTNVLGTSLISQLMNPKKATGDLNLLSIQNSLTPNTMQYGIGGSYLGNNFANKNLQSLIDGSISSSISKFNNYLKRSKHQTSTNRHLTSSISNFNNYLRNSPLQSVMGGSQANSLLNLYRLLGISNIQSAAGGTQTNTLSNLNSLIGNSIPQSVIGVPQLNSHSNMLGRQYNQNIMQPSQFVSPFGYNINSLLSNGLLSDSYYGTGTGNNALLSSLYQPGQINSVNSNAILAALG